MIGVVLNDRYRLDAELGRGGMGVVYRARDLLLHRDVAVKVVSRAFLGTEGRARLLREARSAAQLNHRNVVSIHDAGEAALPGVDEPVPFIVMELVAGPSLHDCPPPSLPDALRLAAQVCAALEHAHSHGIVHRDLKPENVLLAPGDAGEKAMAKLNDFGLARSMASRLSTDGTIVGTVFYLAPELALGQECDGRADLYALGVMLYELATGELPFTAADPVAVISQHLHAPPVPPRARNAAVPAALEAVILRLLAKRPEDRLGSAAEVGDLLERLAAGEAAPALAPARTQELSMLDRIARGRLVAREAELGYMRAVWQRAAGGAGQVLLVSGEPGVGKSRLVRELVTQVQVAGDRALVGECYAEGDAPYAPFGQMVRQAFHNGDGGDGLGLPEFVLADLVALAPALRRRFPAVLPNPVLDPESEQQRLSESVVALCAALAALGPLLLVLEDGHWADSGSLALLRHLARRTRTRPVLIVVTHREVELDEARPFRDVLVDLNRERLATRLKLARLDREGTRLLLAALFADEITPEFLDGIYRETEGNPFFVEEVCKELVENGSVYYVGGKWDRAGMDRIDVPQSVRLAIQSRVGRLPGEVQQVLHMAALLGREFNVDVLMEAMSKAGVDEESTIGALEAATSAQVIEEVRGTEGVFFAFVHALIATTLAEEVPTLRRRRLHRQAAEAIERLHPEDDEALAHHYAAAGAEDRAFTYSVRAGDRAAAAYANVEAERHYRAALEVVRDGRARAGLLGKLGIVEARQSRYEEAVRHWRLGIDLFGAAGDRDGVACLYAYVARALSDTVDNSAALSMCREGMAAVARMGVEPAGTVGEARLLHATASACYFSGLHEEATSLGRQALELAERLGAVDLQSEGLTTLALLPNQTSEQRVALLIRALKLAEAAGLLPQAARAENDLAVEYAELGDPEAGRAHFLRAAELAHQMASPGSELFYRSNAALYTAWVQGLLVTAEQDLVRLRELEAALPESDKPASGPAMVSALVLRHRGQLSDAAEHLRALRKRLAAKGDLQLLALVSFMLADTLFEMGEDREGEAAASEAIRASDQQWGSGIAPVSLLSAWHAGCGELEQARALLSEARELAAAGRSIKWDRLWLGRAEAHLAAAEGRWPEALAGFSELAAELRHRGMNWYWARAVSEWAEALLARGEPGDSEQALSLLGQAADEFEAIGAPYYAEKARRRMNEIGPA